MPQTQSAARAGVEFVGGDRLRATPGAAHDGSGVAA